MTTGKILKALKQALRAKGITYRQAAEAMELSESSVKRLFTEQSFTLPRLEQLCQLAGTDLARLLQQAESDLQKLERLNIEQEQEIVSNPLLLLVGVCIINQCSFEEILNKYTIKETELIQCFARFDKLGVIEYLPGNRYRLKLSKNFSWNHNGPIQRFFIETLLQDYLSEGIQNYNNHFHYVWGMLTKQTARELKAKIQHIVSEYVQLASQEARLPIHEKMTSSLLVLFREDWEPGIFKNRQQLAKMS